jgi:hypothetical protein
MSVAEFVVATAIAGVGEYFVFKYMRSEGRFKVSGTERLEIQRGISEVIKMPPEQMMAITRKIRDDLAPKSNDLMIRELLQFTWGLSEEVSDQIADKYGTQFSLESKKQLDDELNEYLVDYEKGLKLETIDLIAITFKRLFTRKYPELEYLDREILSKELQHCSEELAKGQPSSFLDVLSKYAQRPFGEADVLLFMNALNDMIYRVRSNLQESPRYYQFLRDIHKEIARAAKALSFADRFVLYESYDKALRKAAYWIETT